MQTEIQFSFTLATTIHKNANNGEVNVLFENDDYKVVFELFTETSMIIFRRVDKRNIAEQHEIVSLGNTVHSVYAAINIESIFLPEWVTYYEHRN